MIYKCKYCESEFQRGLLPPASCGILLLAIAVQPIIFLWHPTKAAIGGWVYLVCAPAFITFFLVIMISVAFAEALWALLRGCPNCGKRTLSRGYTRGFGL
jgi:hypothetical protein